MSGTSPDQTRQRGTPLVRQFLIGAVHTLVADHGIRKFLDTGSGLSTADNTHDVAQGVAPESRVVYVDHDPVVISHSRALLTSSAEGRTASVHADLRDSSAIITQAAQVLHFTQPVAVTLIALLHFIPDHDDPYAVVRRLMDAVPAGSFLVLGHAASDIAADAGAEMTRRYNARSAVPITLRRNDQVARFSGGMDMPDPGLAPLAGPRPGRRPRGRRADRLLRHRPQAGQLNVAPIRPLNSLP